MMPSPRSVRHALGVLLRLPPEAQAAVVERLLERLDAEDGDVDLEPEEDDDQAGAPV